MNKESLNFGGMDLISKGTGGQRILEHDRSAFYHPQKNGWILIKLSLIYVCEMRKNLIRFGDLDSILKVTGGQKSLTNALSATYLLNGFMDFNETSTDISSGNGTDWSFFCNFVLVKVTGVVFNGC